MVINDPTISAKCLEEFLFSIYMEETSQLKENLSQFYRLAIIFKMKDLEE